MKKKGTVYFFTGFAGAGKTTIGGLFYRRLKERSPDAVLLDGDQMRAAAGDCCPKTGVVLKEERYTTEARRRSARETFRRCKALADEGKDVVCCCIAMYSDVRRWNRENIENYKEIYVRVTRETLCRRDQKKLYSSGAKNVVGVDLPYDEPRHSHVVIQNDGEETPEAIVDRLEAVFGVRKVEMLK